MSEPRYRASILDAYNVEQVGHLSITADQVRRFATEAAGLDVYVVDQAMRAADARGVSTLVASNGPGRDLGDYLVVQTVEAYLADRFAAASAQAGAQR